MEMSGSQNLDTEDHKDIILCIYYRRRGLLYPPNFTLMFNSDFNLEILVI